MRNDLLLILQSCDSIRDLNEEFKKPLGWLRIKEKLKCRKLKNLLIEKIYDLQKDEWTLDYLLLMEKTLIAYYNKLENYLDDISIQDHHINTNTFKPMFFTNVNGNHAIILELVTNSISFTVFDTISGNTFESSSVGVTSSRQKRLENICKDKIIEMLLRYLDGITLSDKESSKLLMKKVEERYKNI